jgi:colanic acid/amylovoran biosynthesis protein
MSDNRKEIIAILLGASFSMGNMGVGALAAGAIESILSRFNNAKIYFLDYSKERITYNYPKDGGSIPIRLLNLRFSKKFYLKNNIALLIIFSLILKLIFLKKIKNKIIEKNFYLNIIDKADLVASIAGGDSFSDIYGLRRFFYAALPQILVLLVGKKLVLLPQTIGPFKGGVTKMIAKYILRRAARIYSRDMMGIKTINDLAGSNSSADKIRFSYDIGFAINPVRPDNFEMDAFFEKRDNKFRLIGLNISGLLYMGGYSRNNMSKLKVEYKELIYNLINYLIEVKGLFVMLVPHVFGVLENSETDSVVSARVYEELKSKYSEKLLLIEGWYNQNEIKYVIGMCDFFIGSRMHACIAALSQNVPTVAMAYSDKFIGVMDSVGIGDFVVDLRKSDFNDVINLIDKAYSERDLIQKHLKTIIPGVKKSVLNLFNEISMISDTQ